MINVQGDMCGIVGYVGEQQARDVVVEGLRRLLTDVTHDSAHAAQTIELVSAC